VKCNGKPGRGVGGAHSTEEGKDSITLLEGRGPTLLRRLKKVRARECRKANDPMDKARELQRTLYRAAKRSATRRFHALYDKMSRRDILWRAEWNRPTACAARACPRMKSIGEPYEGEPHVRFDEGEQGRPSGCLGYGRLRHSPGNGE